MEPAPLYTVQRYNLESIFLFELMRRLTFPHNTKEFHFSKNEDVPISLTVLS